MRTAMVERPGDQQQQRGPQPLAAGADDVFGDLVDEHDVGPQAMPDQRVHRHHVVGDRQQQRRGLRSVADLSRQVGEGVGVVQGGRLGRRHEAPGQAAKNYMPCARAVPADAHAAR